MTTLYDRIGGTYSASRAEEPRIAALIRDGLGSARSVVNVGAGTGAYEPTDREVLAVEPSATMIAQRRPGAARVFQASAEKLPFDDRSVDAALAVNTVHHWTDLRAGLRELRRIARLRVVIFLRNPNAGAPFWLTDHYLPDLDSSSRTSRLAAAIADEFPSARALPFRLPRDCADGLFTAYWGRPELYLDSERRRNISNFALAGESGVARGLSSLRFDLESGTWDRMYGHLRALSELDLGHRLLVADLGSAERK